MNVVVVCISQGAPEKTDPIEIYFEELTHAIVEADKSEICGAGWQLRQELVLQSRDRFLLQETSVFVLKASAH